MQISPLSSIRSSTHSAIFTSVPLSMRSTLRVLFALTMLAFVPGCSWIPWFKSDAANCMDNNSCETAENTTTKDGLDQPWYCYGAAKNEPWDCVRKKDSSKIKTIAVNQEPSQEEVSFEDSGYGESGYGESGYQESRSADDGNTSNTPGTSRAELKVSDEISFAHKSVVSASDLAGIGASPLFPTDSTYAVQLIALQSIDALQVYAAAHQIDEPLYVRINSQQQNWYVLLLDTYPTREEAEAAASNWEAVHQPESRPWVRPLGPLIQAVEEAAANDM